ncbi:MAG: UvrD-helicase domain-containing protein [Proteobacteria bacterium]|nr:UvrD-helicase domain-containing protein [Pseudomonadota bacterium]
MTFIADLHIHSKYSRATAKNLDLENLYQAAQIKGISVVGTGDFTFPAWMDEIESKLEPAEPGLFSLKKQIADKIDQRVPPSCRNTVRFVLQTEISNIYKKEGRVRKNHNLVYFPDLLAVKKFNARLDNIGNIKSDGRPILGLDARALLEIVLETCEAGLFVPAHIWTPWFSMFGSKSGFDTIEACFGDLTPHIFAVETGLSSDPPMNWRVSGLDQVSLISNSDAHSPGYLGRNASVFDTDLNYFAMRAALETGDMEGFKGTLDMFPHQGKYHYDGHRKCNVSLDPAESEKLGNICPECKKSLTLGVLHRVRELADRREGFVPENRQGYTPIIPLTDILSEICDKGPRTQKVAGYYQKAIEALGPELPILTDLSSDAIESAGVPLLAEAILRMRSHDIRIDPGFDGEFGKVTVFSPQEKERLRGEKHLPLSLPSAKIPSNKTPSLDLALETPPSPVVPAPHPARGPGLLEGLNPGQKQAVESLNRAILIQAGPGTGKTRTLTAKIAHLISEKKTDPSAILALTFTNKAAKELTRRIETFLPKGSPPVLAATFHGFCLKILKENTEFNPGLMDESLRLELMKNAFESAVEPKVSRGDKAGADKIRPGLSPKKRIDRLDRLICQCKQQLLGPEDDLSSVAGEPEVLLLKRGYANYMELCRRKNLVDFEDLIFVFYHHLVRSPDLLARVRNQFAHIFIDEYQDLNLGQYELVKLLAQKSHLVVIGDPDQSIYGFRGSDNTYFRQFAKDYPGCEQIRLIQNYRSTQTILDASFQMMTAAQGHSGSGKIFSNLATAQKVIIKQTASPAAEAVAVGMMIEKLMGGLSFFSMERRNQDTGNITTEKAYSFADFAVLFRTKAQGKIFSEVFSKHGIPFQTADKKGRFDQDGICQVLSLLRMITGRSAAMDSRILKDHFDRRLKKQDPSRGQGQVQQLFSQVPSQVRDLNTSDCLEFVVDVLEVRQTIREKRSLAAVYEHLAFLARLYPCPSEFMAYLVLDQDPDYLSNSVERVSLMTLHSAKGLEYPVVFVTGCEQGLIPFARNGETCENPEEERRLFYVAMTRAMDILCLTYAQKRRIYGTSQKRQRSFFIDDIETRLAKREAAIDRAKDTKKQIQLELF